MKLCDELEARQKKKQETRILINNAALNKLLTADTPETFTKNWQRIGDNFDILYSAPENIGKLRQAILQLAVMGKLVPQDANDEPAAVLLERIKKEKERLIKEGKIKKEKSLPEIKDNDIPFELPQGWEWVRFCDIATIASNLVKPELYLDLPHIAPDNIEKQTGKLLPYRTVKEDNVSSAKHKFFSGQLLYSKIRPNLAKVTIIQFDGVCSADMYPINSYIHSKYLVIYMLSRTFLNMAIKNDTRVAMPKINQEELNKILVSLPSFEEQKRIVTKVDKLMKLCDELETKLTQTQTESEKIINAAVKQLLTV
jgi:type I restriction enzyme S subunit